MKILPSLFDASQHVSEDELVEFENCPVCGFQNHGCNVGLAQEHPMVLLRKCEYCKAVSTSHKPLPHVLKAYYTKHFSKQYCNYNEVRADVTFSGLERFANHLNSILKEIDFFNRLFRLESINVLDYGGGDGALTVKFAKLLPSHLKINITVVDFGNEICKSNERQISVTKTNNIDECLNNFDIIIASASLEHIPDLKEVIFSLISLLKPGGVFYARTPYIIPIKRIVPLLEFGFPAHIHDLGSDFWNRFPDTYSAKFKSIISRPSIIEVAFKKNPIRYLLTYLLKLPCHVETKLVPFKKNSYLWPFVGGWEVLFQLDDNS